MPLDALPGYYPIAQTQFDGFIISKPPRLFFSIPSAAGFFDPPAQRCFLESDPDGYQFSRPRRPRLPGHSFNE
jgi:hypothetical protein